MNVQTIKIDLYDPKVPQIEIGPVGTQLVEAIDFELNSAEWNGLTLLVSFLPSGAETGVSVLYDGEPITIPSEVTSKAGYHKMIISGTRGSKIIKSKLIKLFVSSDTMSPCITPDPEPTPSTYAQVVDMMEKQAVDAVDAEAAQSAAETAKDETQSLRNETEELKDTAVGAAQTATEQADRAEKEADDAETSKDDAEQSKTAAQSAQGSAETACADSRKWADGAGATSADPQFENNAKYYAGLVEADKDKIIGATQDAENAAEAANTAKENADAAAAAANEAAEKPITAYELATKNGYIGTEEQWLASLVGAKGDDGHTPVKGIDYWTEADKGEIIQAVVDIMGGALIGYVDDNNNIILVGGLADETYTVKYEMEDGSTIDIGELTLGTDEPKGNLADPTSTDWLTDTRLSTSMGDAKPATGSILTNYIPAKVGDIIRVKGLNLYSVNDGNHCAIGIYSSTETTADANGRLNAYQDVILTDMGKSSSSDGAKEDVFVNGDIYTYTIAMRDGTQRANASTAYCRISAPLASDYTANDVIITINEEIV